MSEEEIWAVIRAEPNPVFRAIWLLAAFGGPRISEQLNLWQIDILPASYHAHFLGYDYDSCPLVLKADPRSSRYTGDVAKPGPSRRAYLQERYGGRLRPRPDYPLGDPLRAGWKSMLYLNPIFDLTVVFWINAEASALFEECVGEIRRFHHHHQTSKNHPWFYVNLADPTGDYRAQPMKMSNVQNAWNRACMRCGLEPHRWGRNLHALRHYYKHYAEHLLQIRPEILQIMLGHTGINSQHDYGRLAKDAHDGLKTSPLFSGKSA